MRWLITLAKSADMTSVRLLLAQMGGTLEADDAIALEEEQVVPVEGPPDLASKVQEGEGDAAAAGIVALHPDSGLSYY